LATSIDNLKERLGKILIGYSFEKQPIYVKDLAVQGALALLLKDALKPNLVQTIEGTPALIHGGPFANIAHGCNSVIATETALHVGEYTVTEAGFGADLGAEKFLDIKTPNLSKAPDAIVVVATIRALKMHGGVAVADLGTENLKALERGFSNLKRHVENMRKYGIPVVVALNEFSQDTEAERTLVETLCQQIDVTIARTAVWAEGGAGGTDLAKAVVQLIEEKPANYHRLYTDDLPLADKASLIVREIYGGAEVEFAPKAKAQLQSFKEQGWDQLPICMAKTQYSFSDDPKRLGAPDDFTVTIREFVPKLGAGFIVALTGAVMTMPGLPKKPAAINMDVTSDGQAIGLF